MAVNPLLPDPVSPDPVSGALPLTGTADLVKYAPFSDNKYELELSANDSDITTNANYFENKVDAYNVFAEGNRLNQINNYLTEIPSDENIFSFGKLTFTNKTLNDDEGKNIERAGILRGKGGAIGNFSFNFGNRWRGKEDQYLPYSGTITVDPSTLNKPERVNRLKDVLLHEIGHVLGFDGYFLEKRDDLLLKEKRQLKQGDKEKTVNFYGFKGAKALQVFNNDPTFRSSDEYQRLYGQETNVEEVPLAYDRPSWPHWNEGIFGDELMTPILTSSNLDLSSQKLTIAAIQDMGYTVAPDLEI